MDIIRALLQSEHQSHLVLGRLRHPSSRLDQCGVHSAGAVVKGGQVNCVSQQLDQLWLASYLDSAVVELKSRPSGFTFFPFGGT